MNLTTKRVVQNAIVAALYFVITLICAPFSFGLIQFRISEALMLLCFFRKDFIIGLTIGCFLSNLSMSATILGSGGWLDLLIGTSATFLSCLVIPYCKRLFIASLVPCLFNGILVGVELSFILEVDLFYVCFGFVFLGELVCITGFGYALTLILRKYYKNFDKLIDANINLNVKW